MTRHAASTRQDSVQSREPFAPEFLLSGDPGSRFVQRRGIQREQVLAPVDASPDELGTLEYPDVLRDGVERNLERLGKRGHTRVTLAQPRQDRPPGAVGKGKQGLIQIVRRRPLKDINPLG
jgi:hypothetical protein